MFKQKNFLLMCLIVFSLIMASFNAVSAQSLKDSLKDRTIDPTLLEPPVEETQPVYEES